MSKKLTRVPGQGAPPDPDRGRRLLAMRPQRALDTWQLNDKTGLVVVTQPKRLRPFEARLARALRGSPTVNRQLDEFGSAIWVLCDGAHSVEQIARELDTRFHERFEPALPRTIKFIGMLVERRMVTVEAAPAGTGAGP